MLRNKRIFRAVLALMLILILAAVPGKVLAKGKDKPYIALGQDLNEAELAVVLDKFGITKEDLSDYTVLYVTNQMEHENLD